MLIFLVGTHIFLTFRLGIIQKHIFKAIKLSFQKNKEGEGDISHFGALATALAATVGTGNIVGVATAIAAGGPGAVLWMWLTGVFGISTKYSEALLSVKFRTVNKKGFISGGPMYVLERGMNTKWLAVLFAFFTAIAAFGIGNTVQANSISVLVYDTFNISPWITGAVIAILTGAVILGGVRSISKTCEKLVPFMVIFYLVGCFILLFINYETIGASVMLILKSAFTGQAAAGGFVGATIREAMRFGVARGLFSNESGLGSAPIVAAAAQTKEPVRQALVSSTGTFWDTVVICAITGITIVNSGDWMDGHNGVLLTKDTFANIGFAGTLILAVSLFTFVFSTILGWSYYGEKAIEYLLGTKAVTPYRWLWVIAVFVGSIISIPIVWSFSDIANALMAIPNLISLWVLNGLIVSETKKYFSNQGQYSIKQ
ncbi:MAG TPA: sodium:alanine symporter family protein [Lentisphaeria bacterium]|nr:sodium:alanine symporter family protein [Lentisphaeria bacterium]